MSPGALPSGAWSMSPGALPSGAWLSSWYVVSIDTGHRAQSPQSGPRWSPAFRTEPVLSVSSLNTATMVDWAVNCPECRIWMDLSTRSLLSYLFWVLWQQKSEFSCCLVFLLCRLEFQIAAFSRAQSRICGK